VNKKNTHFNNYYSKKLKPFAKHLRSKSTKGEIILWMYVLKAGQLKGYQFLRQTVIAGSIADFFCKELKLDIEVDGVTHEEKAKEDKSRDEKLKELGYTTIRIPDYYIFTDLAGVKMKLEKWIEDYEKLNPKVLLTKDRKKRHPSKSSP